MFRMNLVGRVACFTPLVGFSPSGVVQICTVQVPFVCLLWLILIRRFFHDIYFRIVVSIDFVSGFWPQWSFHWPLFQSMSAINIVILFIMFRMNLVGRVACFTPLVGFSPSGVVQICTLQVPFVCLLWLILIRRFFHDIYFRIVVSIDFVSGFWPQWSFHWLLFQSMSAINIVILFIMFRMKLVGRVACFTPLVGFSPSGVVQICTVQVPFVFLLWLILIRRFFHDIYFRIVVSIDFVSGILQSCFQHVEHTRLKGLIQGLPAVLLKSKAGGASAAADAQVSDRLFKRHGRWKSDKAKDDYIKDNILSLLSVSLSLGI